MADRLLNKVAVVTGAGGGIGRAVASLFAREGAQVAVVDLNSEHGESCVQEIRQTGGEAIFLPVDMTRANQVEAGMGAAIERFGRIDILVNVAGGSGRRWGDGPTDACTEEGWNLTLDMNLKSTFLGCKYALQMMLAEGSGVIVNTSSVLGLVGGDEDFATHAYAASKGGVISLTRSIAAYYAPRKIRANVLCPGLIATPMSQRAQESEEIHGRLAKLQPLTGDFGLPGDVAHAALFLASDEAAFITGAVLTVDGGWTVV
jgi:NAD(P)-dependent dehydrogenase (short-subunit alcohol dehydrogenase family)